MRCLLWCLLSVWLEPSCSQLARLEGVAYCALCRLVKMGPAVVILIKNKKKLRWSLKKPVINY